MEYDKKHGFDCDRCRGIGDLYSHEYHKDCDQHSLGMQSVQRYLPC